jgi:hypothetical protein
MNKAITRIRILGTLAMLSVALFLTSLTNLHAAPPRKRRRARGHVNWRRRCSQTPIRAQEL